jgi:hypothetical protein
MPNPMPPQTFFIDRVESPVGTMLLIRMICFPLFFA